MVEFLQTLAIAVIPACATGFISYLAARNNSKTQIKAIIEQNKADIEKLVKQHNIDIESLKEKHKLDLDMKEKEHLHQVEIIKLQHENALKKDEETAKNQLAANVMGGLLGNIFSKDSPVSGELNGAIMKAMKENNKQ